MVRLPLLSDVELRNQHQLIGSACMNDGCVSGDQLDEVDGVDHEMKIYRLVGICVDGQGGTDGKCDQS